MKFEEHRSGSVSARLWPERKLVVVKESIRPGVDHYIYLPVELLGKIQDDMWAYDSSAHNTRKDKAK